MSKRLPLVCQHLERVSGKVLEKHQKIIGDYARRRHGIYALYRRDKLYYVGLATNLRSRLKGHLRDRHKGLWDRFSMYLTIGNDHLKELESLVLRITQPPGNKIKGKLARSENLQRRLARDIRTFYREEMEALFGKTGKKERKNSLKRKKKSNFLAHYVKTSLPLRAQSKGKRYTATLRADGTIRLKGKIFNSPSQAARVALGRSCNGWWWWWCERAPADWIRLDELRK